MATTDFSDVVEILSVGRIRIQDAATYQDTVDDIGRCLFDEWSYDFCTHMALHSADAVSLYYHTKLAHEYCTSDTRHDVIAFVARDKRTHEFLGTVSLDTHDMHIAPNLEPWVSNLYVKPSHRRHGIATALMKHVIDYAMNVVRPRKIYIWTADETTKDWYSRRFGFRQFTERTFDIHPIAYMMALECTSYQGP